LVERCVRDAEAVGSNPTSPTTLSRMFHVYVLRSEKTGRRYVGSSQDLEKRLREHNSGQSLATRHGAPWKLIHHEEFPTRAEAVRRERFYKTGKGRETLDQLPE
jgi:putative endonuclease